MNAFTKEELSVTIKYVEATTEQLNHFLCIIENKKCIYPWESKAERLKRFEGLEVSRQAILRELESRL
jgi:hypothetical protein